MGAPAEHDLSEISRRLRPGLMAFFLRRVRDHAEAEDLTQEVFARLTASEMAGTKDPEAYMFRVAGNLLADRGRRAKVRATYNRGLAVTEDIGVETLDPERFLAGKEAIDRIEAALCDLPERTRAIFLLFRLEGVRRREIAWHYGISESAVDKHLTKAMRRIMDGAGEMS